MRRCATSLTVRLASASPHYHPLIDVTLGEGAAMFATTGAKKGSQRKRDRVNERNRLYNQQWKSKVRTYTKRFLSAMAAFDLAPSVEARSGMAEALAEVYRVCDKCKVKGVLHRNTAVSAVLRFTLEHLVSCAPPAGLCSKFGPPPTPLPL